MAEEWKYWIALRMISGVGEVLFRNLLARFKTPKNALEAGLRELQGVEGIGEKTAEAIKGFSNWDRVGSEISKIKKSGFRLVLLSDPDYPKNLSNVYNPPPFLYVIGELAPEDEAAVAVVGTRVPDRYGRMVAEKLSEELAGMNVVLVSGMARGTDSIAHAAALKKGARTIAVLGSGLDVIYPPENKKLYEQISRRGAVISEFPMGALPDAVNFPRRNRIISGLSLAVLVVQASEKSGSLITASFALEQGRDVFAVPGNVGNKQSAGTNKLIKQGAKLVESAEDILSEISSLGKFSRGSGGQKAESPDPDNLSQEERAIYLALGDGAAHIDQILQATGMDSGRALSALLSLELAGSISQLPGKIFQRRA
ncbi:MAG: DNA-processing protein DprA [Deltaproteobacteria bacterium]